MPNQPRQSRILAESRAAISDSWVPRYAQAVGAVLTRQIEAAASAIERAGGLDAGVPDQWAEQLVEAQMPFALRMAADAYQLARIELHAADARNSWAKLSVLWPDDNVDAVTAQALAPDVRLWITATALAEAATTRAWLASIVEQGRDSFLPSTSITTQIRSLLPSVIPTRADLIARTSVIWNYSEGSVQGYRRDGVEQKEWLITQDDATCPFCLTLQDPETGEGLIRPVSAAFFNAGDVIVGTNGKAMTLKFDVFHPPLHPNCRCAVMPVVPVATAEAAGE